MKRFSLIGTLLAVTLAVGCYSAATGGAGVQVADSTAVTPDSGGTNDATALAADTAAPGDDAGPDAAAPEVAAQEVAPAEPCGNTAGKVLCDTGLQGYIRNAVTGLATEAEFSTFTLAEVMAKSSQKYAVVFVGAWW